MNYLKRGSGQLDIRRQVDKSQILGEKVGLEIGGTLNKENPDFYQ